MSRAVVVLFVVLVAAGCTSPPNPDHLEITLAARLIWDHPFPDLVVEIDYAPGRAPLPSSLSIMEQTLREVSDKREIRFLKPTPLPDEPRFQDTKKNWSGDELIAVKQEFFSSGNANQHGAGDAAFLYVLFLNGHGYRQYEVGGQQYSNVIVVFPDTINEILQVSGPLPARKPHYEQMENWVLIHETGHALGLVGGEVPMVHPRMSGKDEYHSTYRSSPMYAYPLSEFSFLDAQTEEDFAPTKFDKYDLEDLARFRELGRELADPCRSDPARCD